MIIERANIAGFKLVPHTLDSLSDQMLSQPDETTINKGAPVIFSLNGQGVALSGTNPEYDEAMEKASVIHADGMSVVFSSRFSGGVRLPERVATTDLFDVVARKAVKRKKSFFILGGSEEVNRRVVKKIQERYPQLNIAGRHHGFFDDSDAVCELINSSNADVLWVGLGKPRQEIWCNKNRQKLNVGCIKTCGGLFAFVLGDMKRAPKLMQNIGLEWLHRMIQQPRRLFFRYLVTNPIATYRMIFWR